jgi:hypothetical protein
VFTSNGKFFIGYTDLSIPGPIPLELRRTYHTRYLYNGPMGYGWDFDYNERVYRLANTNLVLRRGHRDTDEYTNVTAGVFNGPPGSGETLTENMDGTYTLSMAAGWTRQYNSDGTLAKVSPATNCSLPTIPGASCRSRGSRSFR